MYFLSKKLYSKLQINSPNHNEKSACREKVTTELLTEYSQSTVPLPVSSIGRTNRKYLIGIHCILLLLLASVIEIVLCVTLLTKRKLPILCHKTFFQWVNKFIQHSYGTNNVKSDHKYSVIHMLINYFCSLFSMSQNFINWGSVCSWWQI